MSLYFGPTIAIHRSSCIFHWVALALTSPDSIASNSGLLVNKSCLILYIENIKRPDFFLKRNNPRYFPCNRVRVMS
jgi:hypothetical protein